MQTDPTNPTASDPINQAGSRNVQPRFADAAALAPARGAAILVLLTLLAGASGAGMTETLSRIAGAAGVQSPLRFAVATTRRAPAKRSAFLTRCAYDARSISLAGKAFAVSSATARDTRAALCSALGSLGLCNLPPPSARA